MLENVTKMNKRRQMCEKERRLRDNEATILISSISEDSEGTFGMEEINVAKPGPSTCDISPTPRERARKNVINPVNKR